MTISQLIAYADAVKPNAFDAATKIIWINEVEGMAQTDVMLIAADDIITHTDVDDELLIQTPHDKLYRTYLCAMIDFANGEYDKYNNGMQLFNRQYAEFVEWHTRIYNPAGEQAEFNGYYISAYGIAVKHGYGGTEEEWLASLKGDTGSGNGIASIERTYGNGSAGTTDTYTITFDDTTTTTFTVTHGTNGMNGANGVTPERGTDYWTAADIAAIEGYIDDYIDTAILGGTS